MKALFRIIVFLVMIIGILVVGRNVIAKYAVEKGVEAATGLPLKVKSLNIGLGTTSLGINDLNLYSPTGFNNQGFFF